MYENFFGLNCRPFSATADPKCFVSTEVIQNALDTLVVCIENNHGIGILTAPAGLGKTLVCGQLISELKDEFDVAFLSSSNFSTRRSFLQAIVYELGQPYSRMSEQELRLELNTVAKSMRPEKRAIVVIVDEAHLLGERLLEEVRAITNLAADGESLIRIVLSGQLDLEERLIQPQFDAFNQRVGCQVSLEPLTRQESSEYVVSRVAWAGGEISEVFTLEAIELIAHVSDGIPRCINQLCDHSLLLAYVAEQQPVDESIIREALEDLKQLPLHWNEPPAPVSPLDPIQQSESDENLVEISTDEMGLSSESGTDSDAVWESASEIESSEFEVGGEIEVGGNEDASVSEDISTDCFEVGCDIEVEPVELEVEPVQESDSDIEDVIEIDEEEIFPSPQNIDALSDLEIQQPMPDSITMIDIDIPPIGSDVVDIGYDHEEASFSQLESTYESIEIGESSGLDVPMDSHDVVEEPEFENQDSEWETVQENATEPTIEIEDDVEVQHSVEHHESMLQVSSELDTIHDQTEDHSELTHVNETSQFEEEAVVDHYAALDARHQVSEAEGIVWDISATSSHISNSSNEGMVAEEHESDEVSTNDEIPLFEQNTVEIMDSDGLDITSGSDDQSPEMNPPHYETEQPEFSEEVVAECRPDELIDTIVPMLDEPMGVDDASMEEDIATNSVGQFRELDVQSQLVSESLQDGVEIEEQIGTEVLETCLETQRALIERLNEVEAQRLEQSSDENVDLIDVDELSDMNEIVDDSSDYDIIQPEEPIQETPEPALQPEDNELEPVEEEPVIEQVDPNQRTGVHSPIPAKGNALPHRPYGQLFSELRRRQCQ